MDYLQANQRHIFPITKRGVPVSEAPLKGGVSVSFPIPKHPPTPPPPAHPPLPLTVPVSIPGGSEHSDIHDQ